MAAAPNSNHCIWQMNSIAIDQVYINSYPKIYTHAHVYTPGLLETTRTIISCYKKLMFEFWNILQQTFSKALKKKKNMKTKSLCPEQKLQGQRLNGICWSFNPSPFGHRYLSILHSEKNVWRGKQDPRGTHSTKLLLHSLQKEDD